MLLYYVFIKLTTLRGCELGSIIILSKDLGGDISKSISITDFMFSANWRQIGIGSFNLNTNTAGRLILFWIVNGTNIGELKKCKHDDLIYKFNLFF